MRKLLLALTVTFLSFAVLVGEAEAKRLGGARSSGLQRDSVSQRQAQPAPAPTAPTAAPAPATPGAQPAPAPRRSWLGPLAGLAAGIGLAALFSHFGLGEGLADVFMLLLIAGGLIFLFRLLTARRMESAAPVPASPSGNPLPPPMAAQYSSGASGQPAPGAPAPAISPALAADFDGEAFLRVAKLNFVRLQAANDARNFDDLREFLAPELYAEVKMQIDERGPEPQQTDVVTLEAELLELAREDARYVASVRFHGMLREERDKAAAPFEEVWNLVKPVAGNRGWQVAGIQQLA